MKTQQSLPAHLFIGDDGALHDTRAANWASSPLRKEYRKTFSSIESAAQFKATLRAGRFTSLGCYPLFFITDDGAALSFESARENAREIIDSIKNGLRDGWRVVAVDINYEDSALYCDHSGERIESAYAEDDADADAE